jgi:hypothetical protein
MDLAPDLNEFVGSLSAHRVEFQIVGAYALALHGSPGFTWDLVHAPVSTASTSM